MERKDQQQNTLKPGVFSDTLRRQSSEKIDQFPWNKSQTSSVSKVILGRQITWMRSMWDQIFFERFWMKFKELPELVWISGSSGMEHGLSLILFRIFFNNLYWQYAPLHSGTSCTSNCLENFTIALIFTLAAKNSLNYFKQKIYMVSSSTTQQSGFVAQKSPIRSDQP